MGNIWQEKVYTECVGCMGTTRTKQMEVLVVAEPQEEAGWDRVRGRAAQNQHRILPVHTEG